MSLESGFFEVLKVERDSPFGYFLSDGEEDVLLHLSETKDHPLEIGTMIEVFLFNDHKGRIAATLKKPIIALDEVAFLEVTDYQPAMGFFLDNGIDKQILLPLVDLPEEKVIWPKEGDKLLVTLTHDKQGRLLARLIRHEEEIEDFIYRNLNQRDIEDEIPMNQFMNGIVVKHLSVGMQLYLENNMIGFLHSSERTRELRLGEGVRVRVTFIREDGRVNLSMRPLKQESRIEDADRILEVLQNRGGAMPYGDKTPPDIISEKFNLTKSAFKRALGKLMKDGLIYQEEGWTYLKKNNEL